MLIWLGVVGTVLALVGIGVLVGMFVLGKDLLAHAEAIRDSAHKAMEAEKLRSEEDAKAIDKINSALESFTKSLQSQAERFLADAKSGATEFVKSERELADNLAALLREVKVSKQLAQGALAVVEQNVLAVDKLWQMIEMIRTGPRTATKIAPTDEDAAAHERGEDEAQQLAIEAQLQNA